MVATICPPKKVKPFPKPLSASMVWNSLRLRQRQGRQACRLCAEELRNSHLDRSCATTIPTSRWQGTLAHLVETRKLCEVCPFREDCYLVLADTR